MIEYSVLSKIIRNILVICFGLAILFVSVARTGLNLLAQGNGIDEVKKSEVKFLKTFEDGEKIEGTYKLPEPGMLPSNGLYGFKNFRDVLWLMFSQGIEKPKVTLLIADKKLVEFVKLTENGNRELAIESGNEAIDKLKYASDLLQSAKITDTQSKQLRTQVLWAGLAYYEVISRNESEFQIENEKYRNLLTRIDVWNKEQEKKRNEWSI